MADQILNVLSPFNKTLSQLPQNVQAEFFGSLEEVSYKKGTILLEIGQVCKHIFLIKKGAIRHYRANREGITFATWFSFEEDIVVSMESFIRQEPSQYGYVLTEDTTLLALSERQNAELRIKHHAYETYCRQVIEEYFIFFQRRLFSVQTKTAIEKYQELLIMRPEIEKRVSQTHIASYIGIKKETLSRLKRKNNIL